MSKVTTKVLSVTLTAALAATTLMATQACETKEKQELKAPYACKWGMTLKEVKKLYPHIEKDSKDSFILKDVNTAGKLETTQILDVGFHFKREKGFKKLDAIVFDFRGQYLSPASNVEEFEKITSMLRNKFGDPKTDNECGANDFPKGHFKTTTIGKEVKGGNTQCTEMWASETTVAYHVLHAREPSKVEHAVVYFDIDSDPGRAKTEVGSDSF